MQDFAYNFKFKAADKAKSIKIMDAVTRIVKNVDPDKLEILSKKIEAKPSLVDTALKYI